MVAEKFCWAEEVNRVSKTGRFKAGARTKSTRWSCDFANRLRNSVIYQILPKLCKQISILYGKKAEESRRTVL